MLWQTYRSITYKQHPKDVTINEAVHFPDGSIHPCDSYGPESESYPPKYFLLVPFFFHLYNLLPVNQYFFSFLAPPIFFFFSFPLSLSFFLLCNFCLFFFCRAHLFVVWVARRRIHFFPVHTSYRIKAKTRGKDADAERALYVCMRICERRRHFFLLRFPVALVMPKRPEELKAMQRWTWRT